MKKETRKEQIIKTAAKLFKEKGYSAVTMRDIAKALDIKAASLYNHITSKQDILKYVIISLAEEFTERMNVIYTSSDSNIDKLHQIVALHVDIAYRNPYQMSSLNNDWMHLEKDTAYYLELRDSYEDNFRSIIKKGIQSGELIEANPEVVLFSILSALRNLYLWIPKKEDVNPTELSQNLSQVLIHGIFNK
ncbi:MAG: TetR/AcrR family transcriptional regulator [Flavobacteriaceae bacterium]